jgi:LmbE family N-acetylglucosaminyl deacetylase
VVALGAHCDDIEIGAGGLLIQLAEAWPGSRVHALVLSSTPEREAEAAASLKSFTAGLDLELTVLDLPDGRLPARWDAVKQAMEDIGERARASGEVQFVLTPSRADLHQDHRLVSELTPTVFRGYLILEYEIAKWDGDLGRPAVHVPVPSGVAERKVELLTENYQSQHEHDWFDREAFLGLMRVRGIECHARYAEAFSCSKVVLHLTTPARPEQGLP